RLAVVNMANGANVAVGLGAFKFCLRHGSVPSNNLNKNRAGFQFHPKNLASVRSAPSIWSG
ncbi:MAG: hypothetical protein V1255_07980, partial [Alphaproteobacteria bacterium]|nr:hypothetical protein [Alphaproteobacteria bacterium]